MSDSRETAGALNEALGSIQRVLRAGLVLLLVVYAGSGVYVVEQNEQAVELRFGQVVGGAAVVSGPGVHVAWPRPFGEVVKIDVGRRRTLKLADLWYAPTAESQQTGKPSAAPTKLRPGVDGYLITHDGNLLHAQWTVTWRVSEPVAWLTGASDPEAALRAVVLDSIQRAAGELAADALLQDNRQAAVERVKGLVDQRLVEVPLGLAVDDLQLAEVSPPRQVSDAFEEAAKAAQQSARKVAAAEAARAATVEEAKSAATRVVSEAEAEKQRYVKSLAAEAQAFEQVLPAYRRNPNLFVQQRYSAAVAKAISGAKRWVTVKENDELRLLVSPDQPTPQPSQPAEGAQP